MAYAHSDSLPERKDAYLANPAPNVRERPKLEGGKKFKLWGQTKFGVLANNERTRMSGDNIGMVTRQNNFNLPTPENNRPNRFTDRQNHSHVSPMSPLPPWPPNRTETPRWLS